MAQRLDPEPAHDVVEEGQQDQAGEDPWPAGRERLGKVLGIAAKVAREHFDQMLRTVPVAPFPTYMVLTHAEAYPELNQRQLADRLGIEGPTLVRHIDRLVADGLVRRVRDPQDRRVSRVRAHRRPAPPPPIATGGGQQADAEFRLLFTPEELTTPVPAPLPHPGPLREGVR